MGIISFYPRRKKPPDFNSSGGFFLPFTPSPKEALRHGSTQYELTAFAVSVFSMLWMPVLDVHVSFLLQPSPRMIISHFTWTGEDLFVHLVHESTTYIGQKALRVKFFFQLSQLILKPTLQEPKHNVKLKTAVFCKSTQNYFIKH